MSMWEQLTGMFGPKVDMLGFATTAKPSAHDWLIKFTNDFMGHADAAHAAQTLMSGLRFYTPDFIAQLEALPPVGSDGHQLAGNIPKAVYSATGPIIVDVYQRLISHDAQQQAIQAAFTAATPVLIDYYRQKAMH